MPDANSYARLPELMAAEPEPEPEPESPRAQTPPPGDAGDTSLPPSPDTHPGDQTYATVYSATPPKPRGRPGIRPPVARAGATARPASTAGAGARPGSSASRPGSRPASAAGGVLRKPSTGTGIRRPAAGAAAAKAPVKKISAAAKKKRSVGGPRGGERRAPTASTDGRSSWSPASSTRSSRSSTAEEIR